MNENKVAVRVQGKGDDGVLSVDDFIKKAVNEIKTRGQVEENSEFPIFN
jgi:hypothetical protein